MKDNLYDLIQRAAHLVDIERYREAIRLLMKARAIEPENSYVVSLLAQSFLGLGDNIQGLKHAEEATALDPDSEWGHRLRSIALGELERNHDSLSAAVEAA